MQVETVSLQKGKLPKVNQNTYDQKALVDIFGKLTNYLIYLRKVQAQVL
jgi:hypothetical protein